MCRITSFTESSTLGDPTSPGKLAAAFGDGAAGGGAWAAAIRLSPAKMAMGLSMAASSAASDERLSDV